MIRSVAVSVLVAAACSKAPTAQSTGPSNKVEALHAAAPDDALAFLPVDSDIVVGVDANALRASALWSTFEPQIVQQLGSKLTKAREKCGFDPLRTIERVTFAAKIASDNDFDGVVVIRGVSGAKTLDCLARETEGQAAVTNEGGVLVVDRGGTEKMAGTVVGGTTLVLQFGPTATADSINATVRSGAPLRNSGYFMKLYERREPNATVWGMVNGNAPFMAELAQEGARPKWLDGTLVVQDRFIGAMRMTFDSTADADKMHQMFAPIAPIIRPNVEKFDIRLDGELIRVDMVATDQQVRNALDMLGL